MNFEEAHKVVDALLTSEARAAVMQRSRVPSRLTTMERRAIERVLERALDREEGQA